MLSGCNPIHIAAEGRSASALLDVRRESHIARISRRLAARLLGYDDRCLERAGRT